MFEHLAALQVGDADLVVRRFGSKAPAETRNGEYMAGNFFETLGVSAFRGRLFSEIDDEEDVPVAVMSFRTWQQKYGSDASVICATYQINGHPFTIVGISPPDFFGAKVTSGNMPELWLPLSSELLIDGPTARLKNPAVAWLDLIGRVRGDANRKSLEAQLQMELHSSLAGHLAEMTQQETSVWKKQAVHVAPGGGCPTCAREIRRWFAAVAVGCAVCAVRGCANIANLLLARGLRQRSPTAVRIALGASRLRLIRKALTESLTVSVLGATAGVVVAYLEARLILYLAFTRTDSWVPVDAAPSVPVLLFTLGVSVVTGVFFGMAPAWLISHIDPLEALRGAGRSLGTHRYWVQKALVIGRLM